MTEGVQFDEAQHAAPGLTVVISFCDSALAQSVAAVTFSVESYQPQWEEVEFQDCC